jgi:hypothetical protein
MEDLKVTSPQKNSKNQVECEDFTHCFFDIKGIVHYEFAPQGTTVNQQYYLSVLRRLREKIRHKRPEMWAENS